MPFNIAIDGPAGAGKSTIARRVAKKEGSIYVDTGAMYRAMGLFFLRNNIAADDFAKIEEACDKVDVSIDYCDGEQIVLLNGENVNAYIRTEEVSAMASASSANAKVREKLVKLQQNLADIKSVVMDGRDIGTKVLPDASLKIYMTADSRVRAERRYKEMVEKGVECNVDDIEKDIIERDHRDMTRENSPLVQAEDAVLIDTSYMTVDEVVAKIVELADECKKK